MSQIKQILPPIVIYPNEDFSTFLDRILEEQRADPNTISDEEYERIVLNEAWDESKARAFRPYN